MHCPGWCLSRVNPAHLITHPPMYLLSCGLVPYSTHFIRRRIPRDYPRRRLSPVIQDFTLASDWPNRMTMAIRGSKEGKLSSVQNQRSGRLILNKADAESVNPEAWPTRAEGTFTSIIRTCRPLTKPRLTWRGAAWMTDRHFLEIGKSTIMGFSRNQALVVGKLPSSMFIPLVTLVPGLAVQRTPSPWENT